MLRRCLFSAGVLVLPAVLLVAATADANERHFTYTYESAVLPAGAREVEIWSTQRIQRDQYYLGMDQRVEFEFGLGKDVQTSLYLNFGGEAAAAGDEIGRKSEFKGISNEWKWKLMDATADAVGMALYGELGVQPNEFEFESKIILDKRMGPLLLAYNLVAEYELEAEEADEWDKETLLENDLGASYFFTERASFGLEARNHNEIVKGALEHSALFAGPVLAYAEEAWWVAATFMAQLPPIKNSENSPSDSLILDEHEKFEARLLLAFSF